MARILVADDEGAVRLLLRKACELEGHVCAEAEDTPDAVAAYDTFAPDLLILDLQMPGGGGQEVVQQLRFAHEAGICPVLVVSGQWSVLSKEERKAVGATAFLEKPFSIGELRRALRRLLPDAESIEVR